MQGHSRWFMLENTGQKNNTDTTESKHNQK